MKFRRLLVLAGMLGLGFLVWRSQLFTVSRPGQQPLPLTWLEPAARSHANVNVVLPAVPIGMVNLQDGEGPLLIHYWAPWELHGTSQAKSLDSLRRDPALAGLRVVVVCFDPFPSVARFVARNRLRLSVLLDGQHLLRRALPCPSVPFTYVLDRSGRIVIAQPGEIDWLAPATRDALERAMSSPEPSASPPL
jgi:AhpC/TSA family